FILTSCSVFFVSALVSAAYVIIGLTQVLYIRVLLSILINLFLQITSLSAPDIIEAFLACDLTSVVKFWLLLKLITCSILLLLTANLHLTDSRDIVWD
ncbi:hypothetical protein C0J52_22363, partial [Blattella germanica]